MMKRLILAGLLSVVLVCPAATHGAQLPWETIEWQRMSVVEKFEWAVTLFRMGRAADAGESLKLGNVESQPLAAALHGPQPTGAGEPV